MTTPSSLALSQQQPQHHHHDNAGNNSLEFHDAYQDESYTGLDQQHSDSDSLADALQEAKLKAKQRQIRMAEYANRLQEFKSTLPQEHQQSAQTPSRQNISSTASNNNTNTSTTTAAMFLQQPQGHQQPESVSAPSYPSPQIHSVISSLANNDADSVGLISDITISTRQPTTTIPQPTETMQQQQRQQYYHHNPSSDYHHHQQQQQQRMVDEEVQRGVEKVLLAILEASKSTSSQNSITQQSQQPLVDGNHHHHNHYGNIESNASVNSTGSVSEVLLRAMDEVLRGGGGGNSSNDRSATYYDEQRQQYQPQQQQQQQSTISIGNNSKHSISNKSHESSSYRTKRSGGERSSVVDELLAEADDDEQILQHGVIEYSDRTNVARYWPREEKKVTEIAERSGHVVPAVGSASSIAIMSSPNNANNNVSRRRRQQQQQEEETQVNSDEYNSIYTRSSKEDIDALIEESLRQADTPEEDEVQEEIESDAKCGGGVDDDMQSDYDKDEQSYEDDENDENVPGGAVLGRLSRKAGGTTGVVLDPESDSFSTVPENKSSGYFSSVVNYVTSALTPDRQRLTDKRVTAAETQNKDVIEDVIEKTSIQDVEATELMRTLCAHLLPYGVDQKSNLEEVIPAWDEENPNEAGYRIIRLSKSQLRRVERAFDAMITGLKFKSQSQLNGVEGVYDANFIRELQEAERLLDDEERRNHIGAPNDIDTATAAPSTKPTYYIEPDDDAQDKDESIGQGTHPDFPGIKTAGKGEMGDLEYFQLPIIFKSHVTGFEPTKDMVLEPGNVVAGQYLVESELGSAAFSTAYRCIDLSSDDGDGHEEVCLKVIKNTKDFFDQSLDEIKILELLRQTGQCDENYIIRMKTFFYYREHLIIVTELLRQNLFEFGKFIIDNDEEPYFTIPRLAYITRQCLIALNFVHSLGLVHSDIKPENILVSEPFAWIQLYCIILKKSHFIIIILRFPNYI
jgi:hypothetical protein